MPYIAEVETSCSQCPNPVTIGQEARMRDGIIMHEACIPEKKVDYARIAASHAITLPEVISTFAIPQTLTLALKIPAPEGLDYLPFQKAGIAYALCRGQNNVLIGDEMGLGKAQPISEQVLTPEGWVGIGSLDIGDMVIGSEGFPVRVTGVFPQGIKPVFRITLTDGATTRSTEDHLWCVQTASGQFNNNPPRVLSLKRLMSQGLRTSTKYNRRWFIPIAYPAKFSEKALPLHPYLLGALIANGSLTHNTPAHSGKDEQRTEMLPYLPKGVTFRKADNDGVTFRLSLGDQTSNKYKSNPITLALRKLKLCHKSESKFIPKDYLFSSIQQRVDLLAGLMDNDGCISADGMCIEYNTVSKRLAADVIALIRSLGGTAWFSTRDPKFTYKGEQKIGQTDYRIRMSLPFCPFRVSWKKERYVPRSKYPAAHAIDTVVAEGNEECVCISVDAPDQLYVTNDFILTHNTVQALGIIAALFPHIRARILVVCPASLISNWMREIERWLMSYPRGKGTYMSGIHVTSYEQAHKHLDAPYYDLLIVDEAHYCKTQKSKRTQDAQALARNSKRVVLLTGTPIVNRPIELWPLLQMLDPQGWDPPGRIKSGKSYKQVPAGYGAGFFKFALRYCNAHQVTMGEKSWWDFTGSSNEEELQNRLRSTVMVRRMKSEVLKELPAKRRQLIELGGIKTNAFDAIYMRGEEDYDTALKKLYSDKVLFTEWSRIRLEQGLAKVQAVIDRVEDCISQGVEKIILFCHHREVLAKLQAGLLHHGIVTFHGDTPLDERQNAVDVFQDDPNCKVFLGTVKAAGVGITLTAASHVIFAELDPTPGNMAQAEDRAHRIGQTRGVFIEHLVWDGSLDARMCRLLIKKQDVIDRVLNGSL
jgi:hypothetical protein